MKNEPLHNFFSPSWQEKFTRPPKKDESKIRISPGTARSNFSNHKGDFSGSKTWSVSVMASVVSGVKDKGRAAAFAEYIERPEECLCAVGDKEAAKKFKEIENKLLSTDPKRVTQRRLIVPVPKEFLNNPDELMKKFAAEFGKKYFDVCATWSMALHAGGEDLKNPHIHIIYSPVDSSGKNIRDLDKSNYLFLDSLKKDVGTFINQELGIKIRTIDKSQARKRFPKWVAQAYKRAELANDGGKMLKEYAEKYPIFTEYMEEKRRKTLLKDINELEGKEKEFNSKFNKFTVKTKSIFEKITAVEEQEIKNKVNEIKKGGVMDLELLKNINIVELAEKLCFEQDKTDKKAYRRGDLKISIDPATGRFNSFSDPGVKGKGAIDFVIATENKNFKESIEFLENEYYPDSKANPKPTADPKNAGLQHTVQALTSTPKILIMPERAKDEAILKQGINYIIEKRNLSGVKELFNDKQIYVDTHGNAVFVCRSASGEITGAEIKNEDFKGMAAGTNKSAGAFYFSRGDEPSRLILTESAIDAISWQKLNPSQNNIIIASTAGVCNKPNVFIAEIIKKHNLKNVVIAYDSDEPGQKAAAELSAALRAKRINVEIDKPRLKDWNESIQAQARAREELASVKIEPDEFSKSLKNRKNKGFER